MWREMAVLLAAAIGAAGATLAGVLANRNDRSEAARAVRRTAYERVLNLAIEIQQWSELTHPTYQEAGAPELELPPLEAQREAQALIDLHASEPTRVAFKDFMDAVGAAVDAVNAINRARARGERVSEALADRETQAWENLPRLRAIIRDRRESLVELMRRDVSVV